MSGGASCLFNMLRGEKQEGMKKMLACDFCNGEINEIHDDFIVIDDCVYHNEREAEEAGAYL